MPSEPTYVPRFASSASGDDLAEPPDAKKTSGWAIEFIPYNVMNWLCKGYYLWIEYLRDTTKVHSTLDALTAATTAGETAELNENDLASLPGTVLQTTAAGGSVTDLAVDGAYVYVARASVVTRYTRTSAVAGVTYTPTNAGSIGRVVTNADRVAIAYGNFVEVFNANTGASVWIYDHTAAVKDIAIDAVHVFAVGAPDTLAAVQLRALNVADGSTDWSYAHGGGAGTETLWSVATDGRTVFVAGGATGEASGANLRAINADTGDDATGGESAFSGPDAAGLAWNAITATDIISPGCLAVDGERLYLAFQSAVTVESRSKITGEILSSVTPPSSMVATRLSVDQGLLCVSSSSTGDVFLALAKSDLSVAWRLNRTGGGVVATDGAAVFVGGGTEFARVARGNRPSRWLRIDPATMLGAPYRWLAIPQG